MEYILTMLTTILSEIQTIRILFTGQIYTLPFTNRKLFCHLTEIFSRRLFLTENSDELSRHIHLVLLQPVDVT